MPEVARVAKVSKDVRAELLIFTKDQNVVAFSEPDENGLRLIQFNGGNEEKRGILVGSVSEAPFGYRGRSSDIELGCHMAIKLPVPNDMESEYYLVSKPVTAIMVKGE